MMSVTNGELSKHGSSARQETPPEQVADVPSKHKKLHGRAFYESLGSPKFVLAPMVDQSEFVLLPSPYIEILLKVYNAGMASPHTFLYESLECKASFGIHANVALPNVYGNS